MVLGPGFWDLVEEDGWMGGGGVVVLVAAVVMGVPRDVVGVEGVTDGGEVGVRLNLETWTRDDYGRN